MSDGPTVFIPWDVTLSSTNIKKHVRWRMGKEQGSVPRRNWSSLETKCTFQVQEGCVAKVREEARTMFGTGSRNHLGWIPAGQE